MCLLAAATEALLLCLRVRVTQPFGCSCDHIGHVHLLRVWHHCRKHGSRRGVCSHEETCNLQGASVSMLPHSNGSCGTTASRFDCSRCGASRPREFDAHFAPRQTREMCQTVLIPARFDQECLDLRVLQDETASVPPHLPTLVGQSASVTLERHRHSHQPSPKGAISFPLTKNKRSSLCNCVWRCCVLNSVRKEKCTLWQLEGHSNTPAERDNQEREWDGQHRTHEKGNRIVLPSGSLNPTRRRPSCWRRAPLAV